ncbi:hypothetical protein C7974DRAFT_302427 [Boeremia exigua]|uniref:uncharacterized protein n=1 Tax=Boeremia exigua TaxID=749465 RepID=UPI001E8D7B19|nr:uncharacterized protein C7974DRAFT_302427 [Boeremia exigua]KAH6642343.1 hypothetical protein C7974DRAFT_302427 [Boeremia exigua]
MNTEPELPTSWTESHKADPGRLSFLDLPRELRDLIYAHTFHVPGAIFIYTMNPYHPLRTLRAKTVRYKHHGATEPQSVFQSISTGLLQSCRQLHAEACPVLYGDNHFRLWFPDDATLAPAYCGLLRSIIITAAESAHLLFGSQDLDAVSHGWKHRFWPRILDSCGKILAQFPNAERICVPMKAGAKAGAEGWRPAFFALGGKTAERRVELAAEWMLERSPLVNERLRDCLHLELEPPPGTISREEYAGSRFAPDEEEWDYSEFEHAFELMKVLG